MKHNKFKRWAVIVSGLVICILSFTLSFLITPPNYIPVNILHKYVGEDGEVYYKLNIDSVNNQVEGNSNIGIGNGDSSDSGGTNSGGDDSGNNPVIPVTNHQHVFYKQSNYNTTITSGATISGQGCGVCTFASMMTEAGYKHEPSEWLDIMDNSGQGIRGYWSGGSMSWQFPADIPDKLNSTGQFGAWRFCGASGENNVDHAISREEFKRFLNEHLSHGCYIMASTRTGLFTSGGHIILIVDYADSNGEYFHVCNSSGVAANNLGISWEQSNKLSYPIDSETNIGNGKLGNNDTYQVKALWAIHKD